MPIKIPYYRQLRNHQDFLCRLCDHLPEPESLIDPLMKTLAAHFLLKEVSFEEIWGLTNGTHRKVTHYVDVYDTECDAKN